MRYVAALLVLAALAWLMWPTPERERAEPQRDPVAPTPQDRDEAPPVAPTKPSRWHVVYLGPGDKPLTGVPVVAYPAGRKGEAAPPVETGADGSAILEGPPDAKELSVGDPYTSYFRGLKKPSTTIRIKNARPLEVAFFDRATGRPIEVKRCVLQARHGSLPLVTGGLEFAPLSAHARGHELRLVPELPDGWTTEHGPSFQLAGPFSAVANRVRATIPLWPEFRLAIRALRDGKPLVGATVTRVGNGDNDPLAFKATAAGADGRIEVRGLPRIEGIELFVRVRAGDDDIEDFVKIEGEAAEVVWDFADHDTDRIDWEEKRNSAIGISGGREYGNALEVLVLRRDGRPAVGARVNLRRWSEAFPNFGPYCNAQGVARFEDLKPKTHTVYLNAPGLVPTKGTVAVGASGVHKVTLQEKPGRTIQVLTVDEAGRLVPFVPLFVRQNESKVPYVRIVDDVQIVPLMTGADGLVVLDGLGHESVEIQARVGGRRIDSVEIDVADEPIARLTVR